MTRKKQTINIKPRYGTWDVQRVRHLFVEEDANQILEMRPQLNRHDTMVWGFSRNGLCKPKLWGRLADTESFGCFVNTQPSLILNGGIRAYRRCDIKLWCLNLHHIWREKQF
ncbi:hypothetical protein HID58_018838 [Brassica napus]|uniref:Uncharacterized protein n=1 Tax=Brassica napus TaxID=3708 RepID=A0ABQ8DB59_BRANA|nr:hypothetical protein HID58_018838 [Brassica napus]